MVDHVAGCRAPKYCAISVEPAIARPAPSPMVRNMTGVDTDTAATAAPPSRPTQNASISWYAACSTLASAIGIASDSSDLTIGPSSNRWCVWGMN